MLEYYRIDVPEGTDIHKTNSLREGTVMTDTFLR